MVQTHPDGDTYAATQMKRCLISGASGFIGQRLTKQLLARNLFVRGFARNSSTTDFACQEFKQADICDPRTLLNVTTNMDTLFHLAGSAQAEKNDTDLHYRSHVEGTANLIKAAHASGIKRIIYFSSVKACHPDNDAYGFAKRKAEQLIQTMTAQKGMTGIILRPVAVYGPGGRGMLSTLLKAIDRGIMPALPKTANKRSLVHVDDLVQAACLAAEKTETDCPIYTITDGQTYSPSQIQQLMSQALAKPDSSLSLPHWVWKGAALTSDSLQKLLKINLPFNSAILERLLESAEYDGEPAKQALNLEIHHTLQSALPEIIAHYRSNRKV